MKTINITDIKIQEIRMVNMGGYYDVSVAYMQVADDGSEFQTKTVTFKDTDMPAINKNRLTKVIEDSVNKTKETEGI